MIKLAGTAKKIGNGFVPMITIRGDKGRMVGSRMAKGTRPFATAEDAKAEAWMICVEMALTHECVRV